MNKKALEAMAAKAAETALNAGNPYKAAATVFYIGSEARYIYAEATHTGEALDKEYKKTAEKDFISGYNDRKVGYYDKWYRYSRADEGRAYDLGVRAALNETSTPAEMHIIPCIN